MICYVGRYATGIQRPALVELLTGIRGDGFMGWLTEAFNSDVAIQPDDMKRVRRRRFGGALLSLQLKIEKIIWPKDRGIAIRFGFLDLISLRNHMI